jgi:hypothetical protein
MPYESFAGISRHLDARADDRLQRLHGIEPESASVADSFRICDSHEYAEHHARTDGQCVAESKPEPKLEPIADANPDQYPGRWRKPNGFTVGRGNRNRNRKLSADAGGGIEFVFRDAVRVIGPIRLYERPSK